MATFSTWTELYSSMLNTLASGDFTLQQVEKDGMRMEFRSMKEVTQGLEFVKFMKGLEEGVTLRATAKGDAKF